MTGRAIVVITTVILFAGACATTTSHRLALTDNFSFKCEAQCRGMATENNHVDRETYGACLDTCGATATPARRCPPPDPSAPCVETTKMGAWWLWVIGGAVVVLIVLLAGLSVV